MRERISPLDKKRALIPLGILCSLGISAILAGCLSTEFTPPSTAPKTLPATWTPGEAEIAALTAEAIQVTSTSKPTQTLLPTPTPTPVPGENWWSVDFGKLRKLRIRYVKETTDGGILLWAQDKNQAGDVVQDLIIKLTANGRLAWEKSIFPDAARVRGFRDLDDGTIIIYGYYEKKYYPLAPFFLHLTENGALVSQKVYRGHYQTMERFVLRYNPDDPKAFIGKLTLSGDLPGSRHI
ncbi:MAG: hypothetical protein ACC633_02385, partial [Anaerolineales bacterium]